MIASGQISSRERKEGGNKGGEEEEARGREREVGSSEERSLSLSLSLSFCLSDLPAAASSSSCLLGFSGCRRLAGGVSACFSPAFRI